MPNRQGSGCVATGWQVLCRGPMKSSADRPELKIRLYGAAMVATGRSMKGNRAEGCGVREGFRSVLGF